VLDPHEKYAFDDLVAQLRTGDPEFARRIDRLGRPRRRLRAMLAILLWTMAPVAIFLGGWTGLLMAVVGSAYAARLWFKQTGFADDADGLPWWSSSRRSSLGG
jgi:Protein of unknown function (DUF3040)